VTPSERAAAVFHSLNPATEELIAEYPAMSSAEVESVLARAEQAFQHNRRQSIAWRAERMLELAQRLRQARDQLAHLVTAEMGKPLTEAEAEVDKCATSCEYYAHQAASFLADEAAPSDSPRSLVAFRPLGVILAIMPWNYPLWQVLRFAAPALMAGNSAVLKHAPNCFGSALALESLVGEAGFPEGSLSALIVGVEPIPGILADPRIRAVTLTGSDLAGSRVAEMAGKVVKKAVLELGGSDFFLVLADADIDQAAEIGVKSRFQNAGQTCIAAKRFLIAEEIADAFQERFLQIAVQIRVGDPLDPQTRLGPLARSDLREKLQQQVLRSLAEGAEVILGGEIAEGKGFFYAPTMVLGARPGMAVFDEETFGPVAAFTRFHTEEEGLRLANHSRYGLGGNIWTGDVERGVTLAAELDTGGVFVNGMTHSDARIPFGGVKRSGYGRELHHFGIREFTNIQTVWRP
jgi:succinate-semialdehyde dehydrogenase/glutarate-semialdehyde dehydrogenase